MAVFRSIVGQTKSAWTYNPEALHVIAYQSPNDACVHDIDLSYGTGPKIIMCYHRVFFNGCAPQRDLMVRNRHLWED